MPSESIELKNLAEAQLASLVSNDNLPKKNNTTPLPSEHSTQQATAELFKLANKTRFRPTSSRITRLLNQGADINQVQGGQLILALLIKNGHQNTLSMLTQRLGLQISFEQLPTLFEAIKSQHANTTLLNTLRALRKHHFQNTDQQSNLELSALFKSMIDNVTHYKNFSDCYNAYENSISQKPLKELTKNIGLFITRFRQQQQITTEEFRTILSVLQILSEKKNNNAKNLITTLLIERLSIDEHNQPYFKTLLSKVIPSEFAAQFIEKNKSQLKQVFKCTIYIERFTTLLRMKSRFIETDLLKDIIEKKLFIDTDILQFSLSADVKSLLEYAYIKKHFEVISLLSNNKNFTLSQQQAERLQQRYLQETNESYSEKLALEALTIAIKQIITRQQDVAPADWQKSILASCDSALKYSPNTLARNLHQQLDNKKASNYHYTLIKSSMNVNYKSSQQQSLIAKAISQKPLTKNHIKLIKTFIDSERLCLTEKDVIAINKALDEKENITTNKKLYAYFKQNFDKITFTSETVKAIFLLSLQVSEKANKYPVTAVSQAWSSSKQLRQPQTLQYLDSTGQSNVGSTLVKPI